MSKKANLDYFASNCALKRTQIWSKNVHLKCTGSCIVFILCLCQPCST